MSAAEATDGASLQRRFRETAPAFATSVFVFGWLVWVNLSGHVFEFDPDEGNNVIKALLVRHGYAYGTEIWTDQPPLFSYLLLPVFTVFGWTMDVARSVVSAFSALLVFGLYEALRRSVGHLGSLAGVGLLLASALYVPLSVSVMIGLPSVACLTLSHPALHRVGSIRWAKPPCLAHCAACRRARRRSGRDQTVRRSGRASAPLGHDARSAFGLEEEPHRRHRPDDPASPGGRSPSRSGLQCGLRARTPFGTRTPADRRDAQRTGRNAPGCARAGRR